ncbi:hypothetical protein QL285_046158 [Trifolium repens]|nr:hypothetical protein QL285_046158 [Trifolium repens]
MQNCKENNQPIELEEARDVVTTVSKTVAKSCCDMEIINGSRTVADVLLRRFQLSQIAILTVAKAQFSCSDSTLHQQKN